MDTNILVSAVIADGPPRRVVEAVVDGRVQFVLPEPVPQELHRVLVRKLGIAPDRAAAIVALVRELPTTVAPVPELVESATGDAADDRILAAAAAAGAEVLVSGDTKHLLPLGSYRGVRIVMAKRLLAEIAS